jgi:cephalosporin hydroxylase
MDSKIDHNYYNKIQGWFNFSDLYLSEVQRNDNGACFVEVGTWLGKSACYMASQIAQSHKEIRFYTVDVWDLGSVDVIYTRKHRESLYYDLPDGPYTEYLDNISSCGLQDYIIPIRMHSVQAAKLFDDESIDFIFIDADHKYESVKADLLAWYPKVKQGGIIAGHDYIAAPQDNLKFNLGVSRAVDEFFSVPSFSLLKSANCWIYQKG